jgi:hypothetical protein
VPKNRSVYVPRSLCSRFPLSSFQCCYNGLPDIGFGASVTDIFVADYLGEYYSMFRRTEGRERTSITVTFCFPLLCIYLTQR